jgi:glutamate dehydrogenase
MSRIAGSRQSLIARVLGELRRGLGPRRGKLALSYAPAYLQALPLEDLKGHPPREVAAALLDHLSFGLKRRRGETLLRLFNPLVPAADGALYTIVQLVCDDMPFLVDTQVMTLDAAGLAVHVIAHPILKVARDARGVLRALGEDAGERARSESWQYLLIDHIADDTERDKLQRRLRAALEDVRLACRDWHPMQRELRTIINTLRDNPPPLPKPVVTESLAFLEWMLDDHFTFLGFRRSRPSGRGGKALLTSVAGSELGILHPRRRIPEAETQAPRVRAADLRREASSPSLLVVTKGAQSSTVHRPGPLDYVGIKQFDARGHVVGEWRFLGLWTSSAYRSSPFAVPLLRQKLTEVARRFGLAPSSHDGKRLQQVLETWPRDELLQADSEQLVAAATQILALQERRRVVVLLRRERFRRFFTVLVFVPRERYDEQLLSRIEQLVVAACGGYGISAEVGMFDATLVRVQLLVRVDPAQRDRAVDAEALERAIAAAAVRWQDALRSALLDADPDSARAAMLAARYAQILPPTYQEETSPRGALPDIVDLERLRDGAPPRMRLERRAGDPPHRVHLRRVALGEATPISDILPLLENFGLRVLVERAHELELDTGGAAVIQDLALEQREGLHIDPAQVPARFFLDTLQRTIAADAGNDGFNRLALLAGCSAREIQLLRAASRYLLQTGLPVTQPSMERALAAHPLMAGQLLHLFQLRFDPALAPPVARREASRVARAIRSQLEKVTSLEEDRILRGLLDLVQAITRTNYYSAQVALPATLAFKIDPHKLPDLPRPVPRYEIFVHGTRVEGVHLRMGHVARGGLRWSDRPYDFRTEVLGLMKTQHVKNSLIVPVGAKGGFVVRRLPAARDAQQAEVIACYGLYINSLLDLTDNLVGGKLVPPALTLRHDDDDPYLVVAADKGTATFSDNANAIALKRGFWLGDAFASGGSAGYDHKAIGITARGAWECVKRHFRELGVDIQKQDFTVAGIGDMAGDVFGNGMLLSRHIRLQAAFNHQHVFLDPAPDAAASFRERERLFALPRSSWADYNRKLISRGGGIFERSAKSIPLSAEVQRMLSPHLDGKSSATPAEVIRAVLRMQVDLLWNGGIGTYVKAAVESQLDVGDRSNDSLRVDGQELKARVVGEGGNLGFTQRGRVEYALAGGRLNTDSIDNSAGVNTSDVEVNYKILLGTTPSTRRDRLLHKVTDDVAAQVLRNNFLQSQTLSVMERDAAVRIDDYQALIRSLVRIEGLDPDLERLPKDDELTERFRHGKSLTRPELAVLLSWQKLSLNRELLASDLPEDPYFASELERYFAAPIRRAHAAAIKRHRLRREIIATATSNSLINRMGPTFVSLMAESTGASPPQIARAYTIVREALGLRTLWNDIEALDNLAPAEAQYLALGETIELTRHLCAWLLQQRRSRLDVAVSLRELGKPLAELQRELSGLLRGEEQTQYQARRQRFEAAGLPAPLAQRIAMLDALKCALDLVTVAQEHRTPVLGVAALHGLIGSELGIDWLRHRTLALTAVGRWQTAARDALVDATWLAQQQFSALALRGSGGDAQRLSRLLAQRPEAQRNWQAQLLQLRAAPVVDFAALSVGIEAVRKLITR